jgi:hypothetical protein
MRKPSPAQLGALGTVAVWGRPSYMPYARTARTFEACERRGWLRYQTVDEGAGLNGYVLTDAGRAALSPPVAGSEVLEKESLDEQ